MPMSVSIKFICLIFGHVVHLYFTLVAIFLPQAIIMNKTLSMCLTHNSIEIVLHKLSHKLFGKYSLQIRSREIHLKIINIHTKKKKPFSLFRIIPNSRSITTREQEKSEKKISKTNGLSISRICFSNILIA